jgi:hypothetical protein
MPIAFVDPYRFFKRLVEELCKSMYNWSISDTYSDEPWNLDGLRSLIEQAITDTVDEFTPLPLPLSLPSSSNVDSLSAAVERSSVVHDEQVRSQPQLVHLMRHRLPWIGAARKYLAGQASAKTADAENDRRIIDLKTKLRNADDAVRSARSVLLVADIKQTVDQAGRRFTDALRKADAAAADVGKAAGERADRQLSLLADLIDAVKAQSRLSSSSSASSSNRNRSNDVVSAAANPSLYPAPYSAAAAAIPQQSSVPVLPPVQAAPLPVPGPTLPVSIVPPSDRRPSDDAKTAVPTYIRPANDDDKRPSNAASSSSSSSSISQTPVRNRDRDRDQEQQDRRDREILVPPSPPPQHTGRRDHHSHPDRHSGSNSNGNSNSNNNNSNRTVPSDNRRPPSQRQKTALTTALARDYIKSLGREHPPPAASGGRS